MSKSEGAPNDEIRRESGPSEYFELLILVFFWVRSFGLLWSFVTRGLKCHDSIEPLPASGRQVSQLRLVASNRQCATYILPIGVAQCVFELDLVGFAWSSQPGQRGPVARRGRDD